ncbi:BC1881 family protein [Natroniella sp. ANB-PHB2]|uniref:BC1881 family protein n=1 Tax=Natroniella sp. ANB-PHB2 TaxID=3384444 RepID=UPI0038D36858
MRKRVREEILQAATTKELVEELSAREGVEVKEVVPYQGCQPEVNGPAKVLVVID